VRYVSDPTGINIKNKEFLSQLVHNASMDPKLYATGKVRTKNPHHIYGLTQCTRDLPSIACKKCLDDVINEFPNCCDGKGARVVGGSCNFRYENIPICGRVNNARILLVDLHGNKDKPWMNQICNFTEDLKKEKVRSN